MVPREARASTLVFESRGYRFLSRAKEVIESADFALRHEILQSLTITRVKHSLMLAKQETEKLMNAMLPLAEKMLKRYGEFYPYGGYLKLDGSIVDVGVDDPDTIWPKSRDLIYILRTSFPKWRSLSNAKPLQLFLISRWMCLVLTSKVTRFKSVLIMWTTIP